MGELLEAIEYAGPPAKRAAMRPRLPAAALVVVSYETLRSDAAPLSAVSWDYLVLDEGHVIKNGSSKVAITRGHTRSHEVTRGHTRSHEVTRGHTRSHEITH